MQKLWTRSSLSYYMTVWAATRSYKPFIGAASLDGVVQCSYCNERAQEWWFFLEKILVVILYWKSNMHTIIRCSYRWSCVTLITMTLLYEEKKTLYDRQFPWYHSLEKSLLLSNLVSFGYHLLHLLDSDVVGRPCMLVALII